MEAVPRLHMLRFPSKNSPEGTSFGNLKKVKNTLLITINVRSTSSDLPTFSSISLNSIRRIPNPMPKKCSPWKR